MNLIRILCPGSISVLPEEGYSDQPGQSQCELEVPPVAYQVRQQCLQAHPNAPEYLDRPTSERPVLSREQLTRYDESCQHQTLEEDGHIRTWAGRGGGGGIISTEHHAMLSLK